jgi:hypothetical protein
MLSWAFEAFQIAAASCTTVAMFSCPEGNTGCAFQYGLAGRLLFISALLIAVVYFWKRMRSPQAGDRQVLLVQEEVAEEFV